MSILRARVRVVRSRTISPPTTNMKVTGAVLVLTLIPSQVLAQHSLSQALPECAVCQVFGA